MTSSGALLAMIMLMLSTLIAARPANIRAKLAELPSRLAIKCHELGCKTADICALHIQFYTLAHHLQVLFFETRSCTVITCSCTQITGLDAFLEFF